MPLLDVALCLGCQRGHGLEPLAPELAVAAAGGADQVLVEGCRGRARSAPILGKSRSTARLLRTISSRKGYAVGVPTFTFRASARAGRRGTRSPLAGGRLGDGDADQGAGLGPVVAVDALHGARVAIADGGRAWAPQDGRGQRGGLVDMSPGRSGEGPSPLVTPNPASSRRVGIR